jgi:MoaA/NifB/PqqE/SkfB family radical SAM enzyme
MTDEYAQRLSSVGNLIPIVSIDGSSPSTHDYFRGRGSFREVMRAIELLNNHTIPWGFISMVTELNAQEVLSSAFIRDKQKKGAFIARYLEYLPVGPKPQKDLILSGETYYLLEKRKKEIIGSDMIYMQETTQTKCNGLLFFNVNGFIKNCFCFHYARYKVTDGDIKELVEKTQRDWASYTWVGECPLYADPIGLKNHLENRGWKNLSSTREEYLANPELAQQLVRNYKRFLEITTQQGV